MLEGKDVVAELPCCEQQGFTEASLPWREAGLTDVQVAGMLGNGQTLPLVAHLLPNLLFHGNVISHDIFKQMQQSFFEQYYGIRQRAASSSSGA